MRPGYNDIIHEQCCARKFQNTVKLLHSKTCHLRSLFWMATCFVRPLYKVDLLCNSLDLMFVLPLFCKANCILLLIFVDNFSGRSKQVRLFCAATCFLWPVFDLLFQNNIIIVNQFKWHLLSKITSHLRSFSTEIIGGRSRQV